MQDTTCEAFAVEHVLIVRVHDLYSSRLRVNPISPSERRSPQLTGMTGNFHTHSPDVLCTSACALATSIMGSLTAQYPGWEPVAHQAVSCSRKQIL